MSWVTPNSGFFKTQEIGPRIAEQIEDCYKKLRGREGSRMPTFKSRGDSEKYVLLRPSGFYLSPSYFSEDVLALHDFFLPSSFHFSRTFTFDPTNMSSVLHKQTYLKNQTFFTVYEVEFRTNDRTFNGSKFSI